MKDFALDRDSGDLVIYGNDLEMVNGDELTRQKAEKLIGTNKGEWFLNKNQGIDFWMILGKNTSVEAVKEEILQALKTLDDTFFMEKFEYNNAERKSTVEFIAINESGEKATGEYSWEN